MDNRDWRTHLEQMHTYRAGIDEALVTTRVHLDKLHSDIARTLEKISSRYSWQENSTVCGRETLCRNI